MSDLQQDVARFNEEAAKAHLVVERVGSLLSKGISPDGKLREEALSSLLEVEKRYQTILVQARGMGIDDPAERMPVEWYVDEIHKAEALAATSSALSILKDFISIGSANPGMEREFEPFRAKALDTVKLIQQESSCTPSQTEAEAAMLRALRVDNLATPEGMKAIDDVERLLSTMVARGIMLKQYMEGAQNVPMTDPPIEDGTTSTSTSPVAAEDSNDDDCTIEATETTGANDDASTDEVANAAVECITGADSDDIGRLDDKEQSAEQSPHTAQEDSPSLSDGEETEEDHLKEVGTLEHDGTLKNIGKTPNAREIRRDALRMPSQCHALLMILSHVGAIFVEDAVRIMKTYLNPVPTWANEKDVVAGITRLSLAGLACKFSLGDKPAACLTEYGANGIQREKVKNLSRGRRRVWGLPLGNDAPSCGGSIDAEMLSARCDRSTILAGLAESLASSDDSNAVAAMLIHTGYVAGLLTTTYDNESIVIASRLTDGEKAPKSTVLTTKELVDEGLPELVDPNNIIVLKDGDTWNIKPVIEQDDITEPVENGDADPTKADKDDTELSTDISVAENHVAEPAQTITREADEKETHGPGTSQKPGNKHENELADKEKEAHKETPKVEDNQEGQASDHTPEIEDATEEIAKNSVYDLFEGILSGSLGNWEDSDERDRIGMALAFAKSISMGKGGKRGARLYRQMALACDSGPDARHYDMDGINDAFAEGYDDGPLSRTLMLCAYCRAMFDPDSRYDFPLYNSFDQHVEQYDELFGEYPEARQLFITLDKIHTISDKHGYTRSVIDRLGSREERTRRREGIAAKAEELKTVPKIKQMFNGAPEFMEAAFGANSVLGKAIDAVSRDDTSNIEELTEFASLFGGDDLMKPKIDTALRDDHIDSIFREVARSLSKGKNRVKVRGLDYLARDKVQSEVDTRIQLICEWLTSHSTGSPDEATRALSDLKPSIIEACDHALEYLSDDKDRRHGIEVVRMCVRNLRDRVMGDDGEGPRYTDLLRTGLISLDDQGIPIINEMEGKVAGFEPWRRIITHVQARHLTNVEEAFELATTESGSTTFDNLRQATHLERMLGRKPLSAREDRITRKNATKKAGLVYDEFKDTLEISFTYGRITDAQREELVAIAEDNHDRLFEIGDFGIWRMLLEQLEIRAHEMSRDLFKELEERYAVCEAALEKEDTSESKLLEKVHDLLYVSKNLAVSEDLMNRFDLGERDYDYVNDLSEDQFTRFMSDEIFQPLYDEIASARSKSRRFRTICKTTIQTQRANDWSDSQIKEAIEFSSEWPSNERHTTTQIANLFRGMGFDVAQGENVKGETGVEIGHFRVRLKPTPPNKDLFAHPIAAFGTNCIPALDVVVTYDNATPGTIVDLVTRSHASDAVAILVDYHLDRTCRRSVAEKMKKLGASTKFLLIDRVLLLHLALTPRNERLPLLLKCTLPLTTIQPFTAGAGHTPDELFVGRADELSRIRDWTGPCFVYGGRQLGKSALLERAAALSNSPSTRQFVPLATIKDYADESVVAKEVATSLNRELKTAKKSLHVSQCTSFTELCDEIRGLLDDGEANGVMLLIDEADAYLAALATNGYEGLRPLVNLMRERSGSFKFVFAGLHNVARASVGTAKNGILGQVAPPICVTPLPPNHALTLLTLPLNYLGYHVEYPHIETILTNTNYYPGLVQYFGNLLVKSMPNYFGRSYSAAKNNPPCPLHERQLASIINDHQINDEIKKKFMWTLELDEHDRYMLIARIVASIYYERKNKGLPTSEGISWRDVKREADGYGFTKLANETDDSFETLMKEMEMMGVFTTLDGGERYRIRRRTFLGYIGSYDEVMEALGNEEMS